MNPAANTMVKALRQLDLSLDLTETAEAEALDEQASLGDALRDLRVAAMVPRNAIAQQLKCDAMVIAGIERRATSDAAKRYRDAILHLLKSGYGS